jgi:hypothetical protein
VPSCPGEDELQPFEPLEARERQGFARNQNLVPHPVGSAAKPFWAAAVATTFPNFLDVRIGGHPAGAVGDVLGCPLRLPYNDTHGAAETVGLEEFLERSCNRYLIETTTAAFAVAGGTQGAACRDELSPAAFARCFPQADSAAAAELQVCDQLVRVMLSDRLDIAGESCQEMRLVHARFPAAAAFSSITHADTYRDPSPSAEQRAGIELGERYRAGRYRIDVWTPVLDAIAEAGDTAHFVQTALRFAPVSPQATNLALNTVEELRTDWVNLLLGGENSRWSNFELAEGLARLMTGRAVSGTFVDSVSGRAADTLAPAALGRAQLHPGVRRRVLHGMERVAGEAGTARRLTRAVAALEQRMAAAVPGRPYDLYVFAKTGTPAVEKFVSTTQQRTIERLYRSGDLSWDATRRVFSLRPDAEAALRRDTGERTIRWLRDDVLAPMAQDPAAFTATDGNALPAHPLYFDVAGRLRYRAAADLRVSRQGGVLILGLLAVPQADGRSTAVRSSEWITACSLDPTLRQRILEVPPADMLQPDEAVALSIAIYLDDLAVGQGSGFAVELAQRALDDLGDYLEREVRRKAALASGI